MSFYFLPLTFYPPLGGCSLTISYLQLRHTFRAETQVYGQATKGERWMPWCQKAMKDVDSCDKPRGAAKQA